jgi:hypothetical protein
MSKSFGKWTIVVLLAFTPHQAFAEACRTAPSSFEKPDRALTAKFAGSLILFGTQDPLDATTSTEVAIYEQGCFRLPADKFQGKRLWVAINNHSQAASIENPHHVGIQILKFFAASKPSKPTVSAYQSQARRWYFEGKKIPTYNFRTWTYSFSDWNNRANDLEWGWSYWRKVFPIFQGYWHAASRPDEPSAWGKRDWWRVNPDLERSYQIILDNRLISFDRATDERASGIPFYFATGEAQAVIIRYYSELNEQNSEVRLCFENCDAFAALQIAP